SAQGLFMTMTNDIGASLGSVGSGLVVDYFKSETGTDWHTVWLIFAGYSLVLAIIFVFIFQNDATEKKNATFSN
ncbi:Nucleoside H+ symporter, partial [Gilliamella apicola SCGC AB-598-I20]